MPSRYSKNKYDTIHHIPKEKGNREHRQFTFIGMFRLGSVIKRIIDPIPNRRSPFFHMNHDYLEWGSAVDAAHFSGCN